MTYLILPGLGDSGPDHWQSYWLKKFPNAVKLIQEDWNNPELSDWLINLEKTLQKIESPVVLIAHSLAVSLVLHWDEKHKNSDQKVVAALLVAPADVDSEEHTPDAIRNFAPMPLHNLSFPARVVASENDPFISVKRARCFATCWNADLVNIGKRGHINSESDLRYWEEGQEILTKFLAELN